MLDEPTTGLHSNVVDTSIGLFDPLIFAESTVILVEHNLNVISRVDSVVDLGAGAGRAGSALHVEWILADLAANKGALTGRYLANLQRGSLIPNAALQLTAT